RAQRWRLPRRCRWSRRSSAGSAGTTAQRIAAAGQEATAIALLMPDVGQSSRPCAVLVDASTAADHHLRLEPHCRRFPGHVGALRNPPGNRSIGMLPLSDGLAARRFPVVNVTLIVANFAVWLFYELPNLDSAVYHASFYPCTVDGACHGPEAWGVSW